MDLAQAKVALDTLWVVITACLVFFMNAGFALLESGLCQAKNAVNILAKNFIVFAVSSIAFWVVGFGLMFGDGNPFLGLTGWFLGGADNSPAMGEAYQGVFTALNWTGVPLAAKFFFQLVFAGTAATIVSGAVAERIKFLSFILFSFALVAVIYPIGGHWAWGGGWLGVGGFKDFAGSTVVHSIGGWCALMGVVILGPRLGKYAASGKVQPIPGHNMGFATLGTLILWLGWFGFNPGSTMAADVALISTIALNTNMAAAAGCLAATAVAWIVLGKPDLSMILNGTLAGLVAITAGCNVVGTAELRDHRNPGRRARGVRGALLRQGPARRSGGRAQRAPGQRGVRDPRRRPLRHRGRALPRRRDRAHPHADQGDPRRRRLHQPRPPQWSGTP